MGTEEVGIRNQTLEIGGKPAISEFVNHFGWRIAYSKPKLIRVTNVSDDFKIIEEDGTFVRGTKNDLMLNIDGVLSIVHWEKFSEKYLSSGYSFSLSRERLIDEVDYELNELSKCIEPSMGKSVEKIREMLKELRL